MDWNYRIFRSLRDWNYADAKPYDAPALSVPEPESKPYEVGPMTLQNLKSIQDFQYVWDIWYPPNPQCIVWTDSAEWSPFKLRVMLIDWRQGSNTGWNWV